MVEELDSEKYHVLTPEIKKKILLVSVLLFVLVVPPTSYLYYKFAINRANQTAKETTFEIVSGDGLYEIADSLYEANLVNSKYLFLFHVFASNVDKNVQAGIYVVPAGTSVVGLIDLFQHGTDDVKITFLEGWRVEEFALEASVLFEDIDYEEFVGAAKEFEGYLFPDTYLFNRYVTAPEMVSQLRDTFETKLQDILTENALSTAGLTKEEAVIFASIVEREISDKQDRPIVAGILINRWEDGVKLDADATTQYVAALLRADCLPEGESVCPRDNGAHEIDWWPRDLTVSELSYDSLYNTRENVGLPPRPISGISANALESVLNYVDTDYEYYLTDMDGVTHYARTLEEHNQNVNMYLN